MADNLTNPLKGAETDMTKATSAITNLLNPSDEEKVAPTEPTQEQNSPEPQNEESSIEEQPQEQEISEDAEVSEQEVSQDEHLQGKSCWSRIRCYP